MTTSITDWRAARPSIKSIIMAALLSCALAIVANLLVWFIGNALGGMTIPAAAVAVICVIGFVIGALLYFVLSRFFARANMIFTVISIVFLVLYAYSPISALTSPPSDLPKFNTTTLIATEVMHVIAGVLAIWGFTKRTRA
jgi:Na+/melibiose symporter-like transporter